MAKKKLVKKVLDKTNLDEKVIAEYNENKSLYDTIFCYIKCYGGYALAVGAGCLFGVSFLWGLGFLIGAGIWAYKVKSCKIKGCKKDADSCSK